MSVLLPNKYGYFDPNAREFVISRPDTPLPWVNYITYQNLSGLVSHTGGGFSFFLSPRNGRITRWRYNSLPVDRPGRYIYLRDRASRKYWSLTWQPTPARPYQSYECRHGMNYTTISCKAFGVRSETTFFVSSDDMEIWWIRLSEEDGKPRFLDAFSYMELCLGHALTDLINQPNDKHFNDVHFLDDHEILMATKRYWVTYNSATVKQANQSWNKWAFFGSSLPVSGFDGSKDAFIGSWRSEENPIAIEKGVSFDTEITAGDAIASLRCPLELPAFGKAEFCFFMGVTDKTGDAPDCALDAEKTACEISKKYRKLKTIHSEFKNLLKRRDDYLSSCQINVPDKEMEILVNFWNQYQTKTTFQFTRDASYHHGGLLFGRGFRDSCQDALGPLIPKPQWVKERIKEMAGRQFRDGGVFHCYYPDTGGGERTGHSDTPLWLPMIVTAYLEETGDTSVLGETMPFYDGGEADILEHLFRALDFLRKKTNDKNLVLIGPGDWNDTLDYCGRRGKGVSGMNTFIYAYVLKEMSELLSYLGHPEAGEYYHLYETVKKSANEFLWDGEWYIRAINDSGEKIGSSACDEGRIFLNAQSWAVISGVADKDRAERAMASAARYCSTPKGPKILHPPYTRVDDDIGLATRCVPGKKENGAVFNHAAAWAILAELTLKHADQAYQYYRQTMPLNPVIDIDRYEVEPYVYAEYVTSPDHPTFGQASHSWLTGSSAWMLRSVLDYMLGLRPSYEGLLIDPCVPSGWKKYKVRRRFRGMTYEIAFENPKGGTGDVKTIRLNGKTIKGNIIKPGKNDKSPRHVKVLCF